MNRLEKGRLLFYTVRNLKPVQIKGQIQRKFGKKRTRKKYSSACKPADVRIVIPELDEDENYLSRFAVEALMENEILLLHEKHGLNEHWKVDTASHLWNYNLHYLEFVIPLAAKYKKTGEAEYREKCLALIHSWIKASDRSEDAYEPYTISLRTVNILISLELLGETDAEAIYDSLFEQYHYLQSHLETALLANHYFENLKALVVGSILFRDMVAYHRYYHLFLEQIAEQILPDGLHFERSLMYHKIILEDVLRVYTVLVSVGLTKDAKKLQSVVKAMAKAMKSLELGFERTPLFNDSGNNVSRELSGLLKAAERICERVHKETVFPAGGYYRFDYGNCAVLFDCGDIGPSYMGGHAHNDCLSFELAVDGKMLLVNSGTGQYQGEDRAFFRSTAAHNTMMIDDREQSELWGEHRAARRLGHIEARRDDAALTGSFRNYQGDWFSRRLQWMGNVLNISDEVKSKGNHMLRCFFHLNPEYYYERKEKVVRINGGGRQLAEIVPPQGSDILIHTEGKLTGYSPDFGLRRKKQVLEIRAPFYFRKRMNTQIKITGEEQ